MQAGKIKKVYFFQYWAITEEIHTPPTNGLLFLTTPPSPPTIPPSRLDFQDHSTPINSIFGSLVFNFKYTEKTLEHELTP